MDKIIEAADFVTANLPKEINEWEVRVLTLELRNNRYYIVPKNISKSLELDLDSNQNTNAWEEQWSWEEANDNWEGSQERDGSAS